MTVKLLVLYTQPADAEAFERHYLDKHMPLVDALPGLIKAESGKLAPLRGTEQAYYRATELYFTDKAALNAALRSDAGAATGADYGEIAPPGSMMLVQELDD